jgi:hypothetical protein
VGDAQQLYISTTLNSVTLTTTNNQFSAGDVGKIVAVDYSDDLSSTGTVALYGYITNVVSPTSVQITSPSPFTGTNSWAWYGTDDRTGFSNAVAACKVPTDIINIPAGNYLLLPTVVFNTNGLNSPFNLRRGGITFNGIGNARLVGNPAPVRSVQFTMNLHRGSMFNIQAPVTNDYPLVWNNLTLDSGVKIGFIDTTKPLAIDFGWNSEHTNYVHCHDW